MIRKSSRLPALFMLLAISLFSITLISGCPVAQTPTVPPQEEDDDQATQPPPTTPDDGLDRPISQPDLDDTTTSDDGGSVPTGPGGQSGPGGGGDDGDATMVILSIGEPSNPLAVRLGAVIGVQFNLLDPSGAVQSGELLLARDNDNDGQPDGDPILSPSVAISGGLNTVTFNTSEAAGYLSNQFGRFVLGIRVTTLANESKTEYSPATVTIDNIVPNATLVGAGSPPSIPVDQEDHLVNRDILSWTVELDTSDNSPHTVRIWLENVNNGTRFELVPQTTFAAGTDTRTFSMSLAAYPAGTYFYYVEVSDGIDPAVTFYGENQSAAAIRLAVTNRLIGTFELAQLADEPSNPAQSKGAIMQGFNFNDLAGSSMVSVPDLDNDGDSELVIGARFGKPNLNFFEGRGWGEAYLVYGDGNTRLMGQQTVNSVGASIPGLTLRGIRVPLCQGNYTEGLADITVVDDMDGDDLPELVFSFPRVESLNLGAPAWLGSNAFQHPELLVDQDIASAGSLEYDAIDYMGGSWITDRAQFTRGGIVVVSSHNELLTDPAQVTRKFDRVLDLHEIGQLFTWMNRPSPWPYIRAVNLDPNDPFGCFDCIPQSPQGCECTDTNENPDDDCEEGCGDCFGYSNIPEETEYYKWIITWDVWLGGA